MRSFVFLTGLALSAQLQAQAVVTSPAPARVAVTVYRDGSRGLQPFNLQWLGGYALVSETRHVRLPAGTSELRFEGVTGGIVPQSAIVTGLGPAVLEKNRDARLLSPGALLDASLGERLTLRRTSRATGQTVVQDAIVRSTGDGVVIQTAAGIEALRCTGLAETLTARDVPTGLSAKPTLSVRVRSPQPVEADVTLSYISNNFDWQANYIAELSPAGDRISLFAWMTLANGDATGFADAQTQAVAGKLNRQRINVPAGESTGIWIRCWPQGKTNEIYDTAGYDIVVTGSRIQAGRLVPPPPPPAAERDGGDDYGPAMLALEERLGDVRLYRIPETVTVAAHSQKQVAMIVQPAVKVQSIVRLRTELGTTEPEPMERVLVSRNRAVDGLGLPLPAGRLALFGRRDGRRVLIGEGQLDDRTVGEKVEIPVGWATGVFARQVQSEDDSEIGRLTLTNDLPRPQTAEVELPLGYRGVGKKLVKRDGQMLWRVIIPANGMAKLTFRAGED